MRYSSNSSIPNWWGKCEWGKKAAHRCLVVVCMPVDFLSSSPWKAELIFLAHLAHFLNPPPRRPTHTLSFVSILAWSKLSWLAPSFINIPMLPSQAASVGSRLSSFLEQLCVRVEGGHRYALSASLLLLKLLSHTGCQSWGTAEHCVNLSKSDLFLVTNIILIRSVWLERWGETMGGMALCPSNHRNKENIYEKGLQPFKWDVVNSHVKRWASRSAPGVCVEGWIDRWETVWSNRTIYSCAPGINPGLT